MSSKPSRATLDKSLALVGVGLVLIQLLLLAYSPVHVAVVVLGVLMIYVGIWRVSTHLLPDRRKYGLLRSEVERYIALVRKLNAERARDENTAADETSTALREATERVIAAAGLPQP